MQIFFTITWLDPSLWICSTYKLRVKLFRRRAKDDLLHAKKVTKKSKIHKPPPWEIIAQWLICNWLCWNKKKWEIAYFVRSFDLCEKRFSKTGGEAIVFNRLIRLLKSDFMLMASIFIITFLIICKIIIIPN